MLSIMSFQELFQKQQAFFNSQKTLKIQFRKDRLKALKTAVKSNENRLYEAVYADFGKSEFDTYATEISFIYNEINYFLRNLSELAQPENTATNLVNLPGKSKIYYEPYGNTLVIGAWNYPYQLSLVPLISTIAAGNTVILKPSEIAPNSAQAMKELISEVFDEEFCTVVTGGVEEATELLKLKFGKIFFTGSPAVGKIVYKAAAENLVPVTLELGGKSPAIVCRSAKIDIAAKRIVWGKFLNAGQTCIAPDYVLVEEEIKGKLLSKIKELIEKFNYTENSTSYTRIVNDAHFQRIVSLINPEKIYYGGNYNKEKRHIQPTVLTDVLLSEPVMQQEIFGPVLPVISFKNLDEAFKTIRNFEKPLAAYLFSNDSDEKNKFTEKLSFGGGCINDTLMHITNENLPFGGVGNSGLGSYHGKYGFESFSHKKSVMERTNWGEPNLKYPPYNDTKKKIIDKLL